jgi:hypothetical protein
LSSKHKYILEKLKDFDPIYLGDLSGSKLMNRVDSKFLFNVMDLEDILQNLIHHYSILEIEGKRISQYESLYMDGSSFQFYLDHHNNRDHRFKVRYRKYIESGTVFLEVKEKRKGRTNKSRIEVDEFKDICEGESLSFVRDIVGDINLRPAMHNTYERITLVNEARGERVTLDLGLTYSWNGKIEKFANLAIAELKQERIDRSSPFFQLMKSRLIRPYKVSKYCTGIVELRKEEGLKTNRFNKKIRKIKKLNDAS